MGTPHNEAQTGDIAKTVLMPGRSFYGQKYIADNYLTDVICFNTVRNMSGFTGIYNGCRVSVMGSGMGMPSMGIYSYELYNVYDVDNIIRIGSGEHLMMTLILWILYLEWAHALILTLRHSTIFGHICTDS